MKTVKKDVYPVGSFMSNVIMHLIVMDVHITDIQCFSVPCIIVVIQLKKLLVLLDIYARIADILKIH